MSRRLSGGSERARPDRSFRLVRLATLVAFVVGAGGAQAQKAPLPPISPNSTVRVLFSFFSEATSKQPISLIKATTGLFYGTTVGGEGDAGSVFSISEDGTFATLHFFRGSDGDLPYGQLFEGDDGSLYGTTIFGGATDQGTVFRITPDALFTILHHFGSDPSDGTHPWGGVVQGTDGNFYGTTFDGGLNAVGTIYRMTPEGEVTILYNFSPSGGYPNGQTLTLGADGFLYGGTIGVLTLHLYGTIFRISIDGEFKLLYSFPAPSPFDTTSGYGPVAPLVQASDGDFYGTTQFGSGPDAAGTVFRMTPNGKVRYLHSFHCPTREGCERICEPGCYPTNALVEAPDGFFYSTISGCKDGQDCVYRINRSGEYADLYDFTSQEAMSAGNLIPGDGAVRYYSFAQGGGTIQHRSDGDVFSINLELLSRDHGQGW